jgi:prefoldin subunit 5
MKTNHLTIANKYIEKQISKLRAEQAKLKDKATELTNQANVIEHQINGLYESQKNLMPEVPYIPTMEEAMNEDI